MTVSQVLFIWVAMLSPLHEFPDGHIERTISVIVDDAEIIVEYGIGLSDETAIKLIEELKLVQALDLTEAAADKLEPTADPGAGPPVADVFDEAEIAPVMPSEMKEVSDETEQVLPSEGTVRNREDRTFRLLADTLESKIVQQLELQINGERVPLELIDASRSPRHHVNLLVRMKAKLPASGGVGIALIDHNFVANPSLGSTGNVRAALRVRGKTAILSSDVARVMARAVPVAITDFVRNPDASISVINAKILVTKPKP